MVALWLSSHKAILWLISVPYPKLVQQTFHQCSSLNGFCIISLFCKVTPPSMDIFIQRSACLVLSHRPTTSINTTSPAISKSLCICLLPPIFPTSRQAQQISISHASPNLLALIFHACYFYILSDILAYIQNFLVGQNRMYMYVYMVKQVGTIFELRSAFASDLARAIKKNKFWELAS